MKTGDRVKLKTPHWHFTHGTIMGPVETFDFAFHLGGGNDVFVKLEGAVYQQGDDYHAFDWNELEPVSKLERILA